MSEKMKAIFIMVSLLGSLSAYAGPDKGGNGGNGLFIKGQVYLLDLVEAGCENSPIDQGYLIKDFLNQQLRKVFEDKPNVPVDLIATKVSQIYGVEPVLVVPSFVQWSFILGILWTPLSSIFTMRKQASSNMIRKIWRSSRYEAAKKF